MATPVIMVKDNSAEVIAKIGKMTGDTLERFADTSVAEIKAHGMSIFQEPTGNHAGLIKQEAIGDGKLTRKISSSSNYGAYLEYGTSKMSARPHFLPGLHKAIAKFARRGVWDK